MPNNRSGFDPFSVHIFKNATAQYERTVITNMSKSSDAFHTDYITLLRLRKTEKTDSSSTVGLHPLQYIMVVSWRPKTTEALLRSKAKPWRGSWTKST